MTDRVEADLVIAGAGPVGLAVAIRARMRGLEAIVLERRDAPLDKACGEGIMPTGVAALESMGVRLSDEDAWPFRGIRYVENGLAAEGRFTGAPGRGVRRTVLTRALLARAGELGAVVRFGHAVVSWSRDDGGVQVRTRAGTIHGRLLVGADGLHSRIRRRAGLEDGRRARGSARLRYGIRRHFDVMPWSDLVEVHLADGAEAYVTPVGPRTVGVAMLFSPPASPSSPAEARGDERGDSAETYGALLARFPALEERLAGAAALDRARGAGPLRQRVHGRTADGVALIGDAAGYVDALTGQGIELGFAAAVALVDAVAAGHPLDRYEAEYRRLTRRYRVGTKLLLGTTRRRATRRGLVRLFRAFPRLFDRAVDAL